MKPLGRKMLPNCVEKCADRILHPLMKSAAVVPLKQDQRMRMSEHA